MVRAHVHAPQGLSATMLLGAFVDAGASIESVEDAVRTLGSGPPKVAWARVPRGDVMAVTVRIHAPEETPFVGTWEQLRRIIEFTALDDEVRACALAACERLVAAEAGANGVAPSELDLPAIGALDAMAGIVGVCAAVHELGITDLTAGAIGVGEGTVETYTGPADLPLPAVRTLLDGFVLTPAGVRGRQLVTATGAALLATLARPVGEPPEFDAAIVGRGAGTRELADDGVLTAIVEPHHLADPPPGR